MRTGLDASTVAPGNTPPEASFTTPVIAAWASAAAGKIKALNTTNNGPRDRRIGFTIAVLLVVLRPRSPCPAVNELVSRRVVDKGSPKKSPAGRDEENLMN
jgi:hypothetical protein